MIASLVVNRRHHHRRAGVVAFSRGGGGMGYLIAFLVLLFIMGFVAWAIARVGSRDDGDL